MANRSTAIFWLALAGALAGCAAMDPVPLEQAELARTSKPLGGQTLAEKHAEMERTHDDLVRHLRTLDSMRLRGDQNGMVLFEAFIDEYMDDHVDPLLARDWTSSHPELAGLDASIRLVSIEILTKLRNPNRAQAMIDDMKLRYRGREDLMVEYPVGKRMPVSGALEHVEDRNWRS